MNNPIWERVVNIAMSDLELMLFEMEQEFNNGKENLRGEAGGQLADIGGQVESPDAGIDVGERSQDPYAGADPKDTD